MLVRELYLFIRLLRDLTGRMNTEEHSFSDSFLLTNIVDSKVLCEDLSREESKRKNEARKGEICEKEVEM